MGTAWSVALILLTLLLSGFFSGSETAVVSCSKVRLRNRAKLGSWRARMLENLLESPEFFFSVVLVGTNLSVIACTATATALAIRLFEHNGALIATIVMTPTLLIFGEVIPKAAYLYHADRVSIIATPFLKSMSILLYPLAFPATLLARAMSGLTGGPSKRFDILSTREELVYLYRRGKIEGDAEEREQRMIDRVFGFSSTRVGELMIPMRDVISFPVTASVDEVVEEANRHTYSRYPLVSPETGRVVGIVSLFDLLGLDGGERLSTVMHPPFRAGEGERAERLLIRMKEEQMHFAVVAGRSGVELGIITLENILENFVGDIANEYEQ